MPVMVNPFAFGRGLFEITSPATPVSPSGFSPLLLCPLTETKGIIYGGQNTGAASVVGQVFEVDEDYNITLGTKYTAFTESGRFTQYLGKPYGIALTETSGILAIQQISTNTTKLVAFAESNGVLSFGNPVTLATGQSSGVGLARLSNTKAIIAYDNGSSAYSAVATVSNKVITLGTAIDTGVDDACDICALSETRAIVVGGGDKGARAIAISGATLTLEGSELTFTSDVPDYPPRIAAIDATHAFVAWEDASDNEVRGRILEDDGSGNLSLVGSETVLMTASDSYGLDMTALTNSRFLVSTLTDAGTKIAKVIGISGTTINADSGDIYSIPAQHGGSFSFCTSLTKNIGIITYENSSTSYIDALRIR